MKLPHRYPFRLVDRPDGSAAVCRLTVNAAWLRGPALASVFALEILAQACSLLDDPRSGPPPVRWLAGVEEATFARPLAAGETAEIRVRLERALGPIARVAGEILVDGERVAAARLLLASNVA